MKLQIIIFLMFFLLDASTAKRKIPPKLIDDAPLTKSVSPFIGSTFKLRCRVLGHPRPFLIWYKDGVQLSSSSNKRYGISRFALTIQPVYRNDSGNYSCQAFNDVGEIWRNFTVNAIEESFENTYAARETAPIILGLDNVTANVGENVQLNCKVFSNLQPHIQWLKHYSVNGSYVSPSGEPYVHMINQSQINISDPETLNLYNISKSDSGFYTCSVSNAFGRKYKSAWLEVKDPSHTPTETRECPRQWYRHGTNCYFVSRDRFSWIDSQMACKMMHGKLAEISSRDENDFVKTLIMKLEKSNYWIGVTDLEEEGTFKFPVKGMTINYSDWGQISPRNTNMFNCVQVRHAWKPANCNRKFHFICQQSG